MTDLGHELDDQHAQERRDATRALLRTPLLRAGADPDAFRLVRRHEDELRRWFDGECGWQLVVDGDLARLRKRSTDTSDATRPARDPSGGTPFSRRRYVLFCLSLAALERADQQLTLGGLADDVLLACQDPDLRAAGVEFLLERREERSDLVAVVRLLLRHGVLARVAGDEDAFVQRSGDVLYDVDRRALSLLTAAPHGASTITAGTFEERISALAAEPVPDVEELRAQRSRRTLTRRLVDDPVVYRRDLDDVDLEYLTRQRAALVGRVQDRCGLVAELRSEGIAMLDPDDELTDVRMPESGTDGHATLLVAEHLAALDGTAASTVEIEALVRRLALEHRTYWRRAAVEPGAEVALAATAIARLEALGLVRREDDEIHPLPALARYAVDAPTLLGGEG